MNVNSAARIKVQKPRPRTNKNALKKGVPIKVSPRTLSGLTRVFKQLADESRLKILLALAEEGEMHVSALCDLSEPDSACRQPPPDAASNDRPGRLPPRRETQLLPRRFELPE